MSQAARIACEKYAHKIRNKAKANYAYALINNWGERDAMLHGGLSYMGAQAVRMQLSAIVREIDGE